MQTALSKAQSSYGAQLPEWVRKLALEIDRVDNQRKVADAVGYSASTISMVIKNKYKAPTNKIQNAVEAYLDRGVQRMNTFRHTNPLHVRAMRAQTRENQKEQQS